MYGTALADTAFIGDTYSMAFEYPVQESRRTGA